MVFRSLSQALYTLTAPIIPGKALYTPTAPIIPGNEKMSVVNSYKNLICFLFQNKDLMWPDYNWNYGQHL